MRHPLFSLALCAALVGALGMSLPATAASFDCSKAKSKVEKALCANPELSRLDEEVAQAYQALQTRAVPATSNMLDPNFENFIKNSQREWLRARDEDAADLSGKDLQQNLKSSMVARKKALNEAIVVRNGVRLITLDRIAFQKADTADFDKDSVWAKQKFVRQTRTPLYVMNVSEVSAAKGFNDWVMKQYALPKVTSEKGSSEETGLTLTVNFVSREFLSLNEGSYFYGLGAAHPMSGSTQINYLLSQGRRMKAEDLFTQRGYSDVIVKRSLAQFKKEDHTPFGEAADVRKYLLDPSHWALSSKTLTVVVSQDSLFSHAEGEVAVEIPWSAFKGMVNPEMEKILAQGR